MAVIFEIRAAEVSDRSALHECHRRSSIVEPEYRPQLEAHPEVLGVAHEAIVDGRVRVAVTRGGELLGFSVVGEADDGMLELEDLSVDPEVLRQGIGRALVDDAAARASAAACGELIVVAHPRSFDFYASVGFALTGERVSTQFGQAARLRRRLDSTRE